jgi:hypothetical protein
VLGYVVMPNHFHVLLYPTHTGTSLHELVGDGKRFMAYDIVHTLNTRRGIIVVSASGWCTDTEKLRAKRTSVFST